MCRMPHAAAFARAASPSSNSTDGAMRAFVSPVPSCPYSFQPIAKNLLVYLPGRGGGGAGVCHHVLNAQPSPGLLQQHSRGRLGSKGSHSFHRCSSASYSGSTAMVHPKPPTQYGCLHVRLSGPTGSRQQAITPDTLQTHTSNSDRNLHRIIQIVRLPAL